jgi:predicted naringenin-chalcone synthase
MSSATLLFLLNEVSQTPPGPNPETCVALGFGPGLMAEGLLLER